MRNATVTLALGALLVAGQAFGQPARPKVIRTEIFNGGTYTVRYTPTGVSPGEAAEVKELERLENEVTYLRGLNDLKRQYVNAERLQEPQRRLVQQQLYGLDITRTGGGMLPWGGLGYGGFGLGYGDAYGAPGARALYGYGNPYLASYGYGAGLGGLSTVNRSLANGVGDEGAIKSTLARALAQQSSEEYAASVEKARDRVLARASESPNLRVALNLPAPGGKAGDGGIRTVGAETKSGVLLTLKSGEKVLGVKMEERGAWFVLKLKSGRTLQIRESEVVRIESGEGDVIKPAAGAP